MTLEADGIIDIWEIETGKVVAQYEGLEFHEAMLSIPGMTARIAELEQDIARKNGALHACDQTIAELEARLAAIPLASMERNFMGIEQAGDYHAIVEYFFPDEVTHE